MKEKFHIAGIKKILLKWHKHADLSDTPDPARALYGPPTKTAAGERGRSLVDFFKQVPLFEDLTQRDLRQLARILHERTYRDGEYIFEEGKPGTAMYIVRGGVVEIVRRKRNGEEVPLVTLEPPATLEELAVVGGDVVHWTSARARGPVSLVAIGRPDLDDLGRNFPLLANKILKKLAYIIAMRLQIVFEAEYFDEERSLNSGPPQ
ncbi:MAG: cyclic nucleotide-binding domain-containing protein [Syntrophobacteraceae bacterium]